MDPITLLVIVLLFIIVLGYFGWGRSRITPAATANTRVDVLVIVLLVVLIVWLLGGLGIHFSR